MGHTPLSLAIRLQYHDIVTFLLQRGADPTSKNPEGITEQTR